MPHGYCSCITLGPTISALSKSLQGDNLASLASLYPLVDPSALSKSDEEKVDLLGQAIDELVKKTGVDVRLGQYNVPESDLPGIIKKACTSQGRQEDQRLQEDLLQRLKAKL